MNTLKVIVFLLCKCSLLMSWDRASSFPYLSGDTWRFYCDWVLSDSQSFDPSLVKIGDTIFVEYDSLDDFRLYFLPGIEHKFILITPNCERGSDNPLPGIHSSLLDSKLVDTWFLQNLDRTPIPEKVIPIPICLANSFYEYAKPDLFNYFIPLSLAKPLEEKNIFVYVNFALGTNPKERPACLKHFLEYEWAHVQNPKHPYFYLTDLSNSIFVASPPGNGLDCHRTWEALLMGCYPIVKSNTLNPLYEDLPVVIVDAWGDVTEEFLLQKLQEFSQKNWSREKLYAPYWFQRVKDCQELLRSQAYP